jgi:hypothetical protein
MGEALYNEKITLDDYNRKWGSFGHPLLLALEWVLDGQDEDADTFTPIAEYIDEAEKAVKSILDW